jgi:hypothetical protein
MTYGAISQLMFQILKHEQSDYGTIYLNLTRTGGFICNKHQEEYWKRGAPRHKIQKLHFLDINISWKIYFQLFFGS